MSFESGSVGFRAFYLPHDLPDDHVKRFARHALPDISKLSADAMHGWVTGRHLLDSDITKETASPAGYLRLSLVRAERKVPEALLKAQCRIEELALMRAESKQFLKKGERSEIRKEILARLLPTMPPTLTAIDMVYDPASRTVYATATSETQMEAFIGLFDAAVGVAPVPLTPEALATKLRKIKVTQLDPVSFSPELEDPLAGMVIGHDFLTWLWFFHEERHGNFVLDGDEHGVIVEGPLTFFMEGEGAHVTSLRNGSPLVAAEAKTALLSGKKLTKARVTLGRGNEVWSFSLDADGFVFRSFKIPKAEDLDATSKFQQRVLSLQRFLNAFLHLYGMFLDERCKPDVWKALQKDVFQWVTDRDSKR